MTSVLPAGDPADVVEPFAPAREAAAAGITAVACVLLGAPVGLLWAAVTPPVEIVAAGGRIGFADTSSQAFINSDGCFAVAMALAGMVTGLLVQVLGRRHGVGAAVGLAVGGLLAAEVARRTGPLVGFDDVRAAIESGREGTFALTGRVRAWTAVVLWPVAALVVHMLGTGVRAPRRR